jgi:hypothetical protein
VGEGRSGIDHPALGNMTDEHLPEDVRRFLLTSVPSVPHLEALLLVRRGPNHDWDSSMLARRLYIDKSSAESLLAGMCAASVLTEGKELGTYRYAPSSLELSRMIDKLEEVYAKHLVEITNLIHSETQKKAHRFADAFRWRKDT